MDTKENTLREAAACGDSKKVLELIENDNHLANKQHSVNGWTALHWAAKRNQKPIIEILLQHGADKNIQTNDGKLAEDLSSNDEIAKLFGKEATDLEDAKQKSPDDSGFVPSYLRHSQYPTYYKSETPSRQPSAEPKHTAVTNMSIPKDNIQNIRLTSTHSSEETVLKARIANHAEQDFIEVELLHTQKTFNSLVEILCAELSVDSTAVIKVRKLPNTILRKDKDVIRLTDYQEIELVLEQNTCLSPTRNYLQDSLSTNLAGGSAQKGSVTNGKLLY